MPDTPLVPSAPAVGDNIAPAAPAATPLETPQGATPLAIPPTSVGGPPEDRSTWVPPYRLRETQERAQQLITARETEHQRQLEQLQSQVRALVGVQPPDTSEEAQIRQRFSQVFPELAQLAEKSKDLLAYLERAGDLETQVDHYWKTHARTATERLFDFAEKSMGNPLTIDGKRLLHASFTGHIQQSPELAERYANDPRLIEEFWQAFTSNFIDPVRRAATTTVAGRAPQALPQDTPAGVPRPGPAPKPNNMDERAAQAWASYQAYKKPGTV